MKISGDLTILLTLKGRHLHSLRWLWHANRIRLPYHVIVADGEVHPAIARLLANPETLPNLSFEHHRYEDKSIGAFYSKIADALRRVRTPYVMMSDNDDFPLPAGLQKSVSFLNGEPDYVCAGGGIPGFSVDKSWSATSGVVGSLGRIRYRYISNSWYRCRDLDNPSVASRALEEIGSNPLAVYYNIYRTQALRTIADEILACNISFRLFELYLALRTVTLGKVRSDPAHFILFRQVGTSQNFGSSADLVDTCFRSRFVRDLEAMIAKIAGEVARLDGVDSADIGEKMHGAYVAQLKMELSSALIRFRFPRLFAIKRYFQSLPRPHFLPRNLQRKSEKNNLWKQLASDGADEQTIETHSLELADIEATLQGDEFSIFVNDKAPELLQLQTLSTGQK